ncbi:MAG: LysM peptidoglycan-binding domain-containing protein [Phycisphaerae bacterium]|nr:LysM peptidoglycan-binding domain-containing protein [Phycisphaerae bacterium]
MKNSAKWELRVGLLLGLAFIIAFGMILSELRDPVTQPVSEEQAAVDNSYYQNTQQAPARERRVENEPVRDPVAVNLSRLRRATPRTPRVDMPQLDSATILHRRDSASTSETPQPQRPQPAVPTPQRATKKYRVVDGDTLFRIAQKEYGRANGPKWRKIYEANRNKLSSPSAIRPGQTLVVPSLGQSAPAAASGASQRQALEHIRDHVSRRAPVTTSVTALRNGITSRAKVHVVKSGDNLTKIARRHLGDTSSASIDKIFEANRDQLDDPNDVAIGMKLRIPAN